MIIRFKGGPGSGHHGHRGRPGKRGGSLPGKGGGDSVHDHVRKVLKVAYKGELVEPNNNELGVISNYMERHPEKVVKHIGSIVLCGSEEDWKTEYDKHFDDGDCMGCGGFYTADKVIVLPPGFSEHAIDHEIGHVAYRAAWPAGGTEGWDTTYRRSPEFDRHTAYAKTNACEAFAESYASWIAGGQKVNVDNYEDVRRQATIDSHTFTYAKVKRVIDAIP